MPITNFNNDHFSQPEMDTINNGWTQILTVLNSKSRNLSPEERQKFGSVSEQNKLVVQKTLDYNLNQPHLNCPDVDYAEITLDWADRTFIAGFIARMAEAGNICNNIRMGTAPGAGWESKYDDLLPFFKTNTCGGGGGDDDISDTPEGPVTP